MKMESGFTARNVADVAYGSLVLAVIGRHEVVRAIRAFHKRSERGERSDFVVSVGPFVGEHGRRPIVYPASDVLGGWVVDVSEAHRFAPSFSPDDLALKDAQSLRSKGISGELLFSGVGPLIRVGNFGATKEPDIDVRSEDVDVAKCRVLYTRSGMAVMHNLSHIVSTAPHRLKPALR